MKKIQYYSKLFTSLLRRNGALASLELRGHLRDKSGVALSEALKTNTALRTLDLGFDLGEARGRLLGFRSRKRVRISEFGLHEQTDLVKL